MKKLSTVFYFTAYLCIFALAVRANAVTVWTQHYDNSRTGANTSETTLTTSNVNQNSFGKLFTVTVAGQVYAQPLYVPNLTVNGAVHNVLFVGSMYNHMYAFDADNGALLWTKAYGTPPTSTQVHTGNIIGVVGIESTPVIDTTTNTIYFVHRTVDNAGAFHQWIDAADITNGAPRYNSPTEIIATNSGVTFDPLIHNQRPALTLANGNVYIAWASHGDHGDYHGWVIAYLASNLSDQVATFIDTKGSNQLGGIWMSGQGLTVDSSGDLYLLTGNGYFDGVNNFGMSAIKLSPTLSVLDYFAPHNEASLSSTDHDLGSGGLLALPGTNDVIGGGKDGILYLLSASNLGGFNSGGDNILQEWQAVAINGTTTHIHGSPVYWKSDNAASIYLWGENDIGRMFSFDGTMFNTTPTSVTTNAAPPGMPGGILSISANGSKVGTGILWASVPYSQNAEGATVQGVLHAYDATDLSKELWNSEQDPGRDEFGNLAKYCPPMVANGKVYMATFSNQVVAYGLNGAGTTGFNPQITYNFVAKSGMILDSGTSTTSGATIIQSNLGANSPTQQWKFVSDGEGYYYIINTSTGFYLSNDGTMTAEAPIIQSSAAVNPSELWKIVTAANGNYTFVNKLSGFALDNGGQTKKGALMDQWHVNGSANQMWQVLPAAGLTYDIVCKASGLVLDNNASTSSGSLVLYNLLKTAGTNQHWTLQPLGNGNYGLICAASGLYLDNRGSTTDGSELDQWHQDYSPNQQWKLVSTGSGYYTLTCNTGGLALDDDESYTAGDDVVESILNTDDWEQWQFEPAK